MPTNAKRLIGFFAFSLALILGAPFCLNAQTWKDRVGFTDLMNQLGANTPDGSGIIVSMVEAPNGSGFYFPLTSNSEFSGKTLIDGSGGGTNTSAHANTMAQNFFGNTIGMASGVTTVTVYEANDWLGNVLNLSTGTDPIAQNFSVQNHSWIGNFSDDADNLNALQRVDYVADQNEVTMVVGTNNNNELNASKPHPRLLTHAFNAIAVGVTDSTHSRGNTLIYTPGRIRPDVVVFNGSTSSATAITSGAATILHDQANDIVDVTARTNARRTETIRSIILAGATKEEFADWDRTTTRPLDDIYGAGELNVYNNYMIMNGGEFEGSTSEPVSAVGDYGYDYREGLNPIDEALGCRVLDLRV